MTTDREIEAAAKAFTSKVNDVKLGSYEEWESTSNNVKSEVRLTIKAALEAAEQARWLPISEAPKDGSTVWGYSTYSKRQGTMYWMEVEDSVLRGHWSSIALCTDNPTHFQYLPTPPKESST